MSAPQIDLTFQACAKHGIPIERGAACAECVREDPAPASNPPPLRGIGGSIHDLVIEDMSARKALGLGRYGTILQAGNGRDALLDAYEEALDLSAYLRQAIEERRLAGSLGGDPWPTEWPDIAVQRMVVYVYEGAVAKDRPEIMWYVGGWDDHLRHARSISRKSLGGNPAPGYYLVSIAADGYAVLGYETEDQRAERLAKGGR